MPRRGRGRKAPFERRLMIWVPISVRSMLRSKRTGGVGSFVLWMDGIDGKTLHPSSAVATQLVISSCADAAQAALRMVCDRAAAARTVLRMSVEFRGAFTLSRVHPSRASRQTVMIPTPAG